MCLNNLHLISGLHGSRLLEPAACSSTAVVVQHHFSNRTKFSFKLVGVELSLIFVLFSNTIEKQKVVVFNTTMKKSSNSLS